MTEHDVANKLEAIDKHIEDIINTRWIDGKTAGVLRNNWNVLKEMLVTSIGRGIYLEIIGPDNKIIKPELVKH